MSITRSITLDMLFSNCRWADLKVGPYVSRELKVGPYVSRELKVGPYVSRELKVGPYVYRELKVGPYVSREGGHVRGVALLGAHDEAVDRGAGFEPQLGVRDHGPQACIRQQPFDVRARVVVAPVRPEAVVRTVGCADELLDREHEAAVRPQRARRRGDDLLERAEVHQRVGRHDRVVRAAARPQVRRQLALDQRVVDAALA